jgi:hypothetical protein
MLLLLPPSAECGTALKSRSGSSCPGVEARVMGLVARRVAVGMHVLGTSIRYSPAPGWPAPAGQYSNTYPVVSMDGTRGCGMYVVYAIATSVVWYVIVK